MSRDANCTNLVLFVSFCLSAFGETFSVSVSRDVNRSRSRVMRMRWTALPSTWTVPSVQNFRLFKVKAGRNWSVHIRSIHDQSMITPSSYAFHCFPLLSILSHAPHAPFRDSLTCFKHHHLPGYTTSGALQNIIVGCLEKPLGGKIFVSFGWIWFYFSQIPFSFFSSHSFSFSVSSSLDIWCQFLLTFGLWRSTFARRSGHTYGPPGHRRCVLFVDDLNMPYVRSRVEDEPWHMAKLTFKVCKEFLVRGSLQVWFPLRLMTTTHRAQSCFSRRWPSDIICHDLSCLPVAPKGLACKKISEEFCGNYFSIRADAGTVLWTSLRSWALGRKEEHRGSSLRSLHEPKGGHRSLTREWILSWNLT